MSDASTVARIVGQIESQLQTWDAPDKGLLKRHSAAAPALPLEVFGAWTPRLEALARSSGTSVDYVAFAFLTHAAALLGNAVLVQPDPKGSPNWREPIALWAMLVGPPSVGKTPAIQPFIRIINELEGSNRMAFEPELTKYQEQKTIAEAARKDWEKKVGKAVEKGEIPPPMPDNAKEPQPVFPPQIRVIDSTIEKLARILAGSKKGVLQFRDELAAWLEGMSRYSESSARAQWLEMYNGGTVRIDRVSLPEPVIIERALISILGGIQPDRLRSVLQTPDDGLLARFLFIWPEVPPLVRATPHGHLRDIKSTFERLNAWKIPNDKSNLAELPFSNAAAELFFCFRQENRKTTKDMEGLLAGWIGKAPGLVARLAGLFTLIDQADAGGGSLPRYVTLETLNRALTLWRDYLYPMAMRALEDAIEPENERLARLILKAICDRKISAVNTREIYRDWRIPGLNRDVKKCDAALEVLANSGWVRRSVTGEASGRKRHDWNVNSLLFES